MGGRGHCYIGTSGWSYPHWRDGFYASIPRRRWLAHCAEHFTSLEVNATFYGAQRRTTFEHWREQTPAGFRFAIKGNRYITHNRKLQPPASSLVRERERALGLGDKLAAVLWQVPPHWPCNLQRLSDFVTTLTRLWPEPRHVFEFRHPSWFTDEVAGCLASQRIALCLSDAADWPLWEQLTTDLVYLRLHGHRQTYSSAYNDEELGYWATRCHEWQEEGRDVYVYFNNDAEGAAPYDAMHLRALLGE